VYDKIGSAVEKPDLRFLNLTLSLLDILKTQLGIDRELILQSATGIAGEGPSLLVSIAKSLGADEVILPYGSEKAVERSLFEKQGIRIRSLKYQPPQYPQFWGEFLPNLSVLDLLFCCGRDGRVIIEKGIRFGRPD
jgi:hypothetical protein